MAKIEYEEFKEKYKENKRLMKKVDEYVEYIYPLFEYPEEIRKKLIELLNQNNENIEKNIYIPMENTESLNVSVAGGILMYYLR